MFQKKSLGQNFLKSEKVISDIIVASGVTSNDVVLEIGPGRGVLTRALLQSGAKIIAIEKDDRLIPELQKKFEKEIKSGKLSLIHSDILNLDLPRAVLGNRSYKLVANIPYYITGQFLRKFLESANQPQSMTLLLQKEVAERIVAKDGKESLLSLSVKAFGKPKYIKTVGRGTFSPPPKVNSAILHISDISKRNFEKVGGVFFKILHTGFAHKRKQLLPNLSSLYPKEKLTEAFEKCGLNLKIRAEDVPLKTWLKLCNIV